MLMVKGHVVKVYSDFKKLTFKEELYPKMKILPCCLTTIGNLQNANQDSLNAKPELSEPPY